MAKSKNKDVTTMINKLVENQGNIEQLIAITIDTDSSIRITNSTSFEETIYYLEVSKTDLMFKEFMRIRMKDIN